jgi:hypothetical protein
MKHACRTHDTTCPFSGPCSRRRGFGRLAHGGIANELYPTLLMPRRRISACTVIAFKKYHLGQYVSSSILPPQDRWKPPSPRPQARALRHSSRLDSVSAAKPSTRTAPTGSYHLLTPARRRRGGKSLIKRLRYRSILPADASSLRSSYTRAAQWSSWSRSISAITSSRSTQTPLTPSPASPGLSTSR